MQEGLSVNSSSLLSWKHGKPSTFIIAKKKELPPFKWQQRQTREKLAICIQSIQAYLLSLLQNCHRQPAISTTTVQSVAEILYIIGVFCGFSLVFFGVPFFRRSNINNYYLKISMWQHKRHHKDTWKDTVKDTMHKISPNGYVEKK